MFFCEKCNYHYNIIKNITEFVPNVQSNEIGYLFCENCGNWKKLENNTCIYNMSMKKGSVNLDYDPELMSHDIAFRKKDYVCTNNECPTNKNGFKGDKEQVLLHDPNENLIKLCTVCKTLS